MAKKHQLTLPNGQEVEVSIRGRKARMSFDGSTIEVRVPPEFEDGEPKPRAPSDDTIELVLRHPITNASHVWVPHLTPEPHNVIGDWVFRSPAIIVADTTIAIAFIAEVEDVEQADTYRTWLDYDHPKRKVTYAAGAYREDGHVFFVREKSDRVLEEGVRLRLHIVTSTQQKDIENPYGMAARFCWRRWGHPRFEKVEAPPVAKHMERIVRWAFAPEPEGWGDSVWQDVELKGLDRAAGAPVFIVDVNRHPSIPPLDRTWREPQSIWNQAWFSTQRCANGLLRYARQIGSADLEDRARKMTEIALAAPQKDGLFPSVLLANDDNSWRWSNSDRRPPSASAEACHIVDAAFTCRMLFEWYSLTKDPRALAYVERFAQRLLTLQRPSGAFPGWVEPDGSVPRELAEGPESAVSITLLAELVRMWANEEVTSPPHRTAMFRGLKFLEGVVRDGRWEDFETYYSCARWGTPEVLGRRIPRNGVYKQNTLSIAWCAEAFHRLFFHDMARRCIDELSLYQAVWDASFLLAPTYGGFGVMNADAEWNDARQSLFAPLYLELGIELKDEELIERGVSALRASFNMLYCPENERVKRAYEQRFPFFGPESYGFMMENQGHEVAQPIGTFTIYTWGNGSALAAVATVRDRFPEIAKAHGFA